MEVYGSACLVLRERLLYERDETWEAHVSAGGGESVFGGGMWEVEGRAQVE